MKSSGQFYFYNTLIKDDQMGKVLKAYVQSEVDDFDRTCADRGCTCFSMPPCCFCTHPGNPKYMDEIDEIWVDENYITTFVAKINKHHLDKIQRAVNDFYLGTSNVSQYLQTRSNKKDVNYIKSLKAQEILEKTFNFAEFGVKHDGAVEFIRIIEK